jgi:hypothetical protein
MEMIVVIEMIIMMVQVAAMLIATARHAHSGATRHAHSEATGHPHSGTSRHAHSGMTSVTATVRGSCD